MMFYLPMRFYLKIAAAVVAAALGAGACFAFESGDSAVIVNSGSTNRAGFRIVVERSGNAVYSITRPRVYRRAGNAPAEPIRRTLPDALVRQFYSDLEAATPLSALHGKACPKSVSFGTVTTIEFGGEKSPDLSCPNAQNTHIQTLMGDTDKIVEMFHVN